jgi:hypothetical protein
LVVNVKVILHDPALRQLQMPAFCLAYGCHDAGWFSGFENDDYCIGLGLPKVGIHKIVTPSFRCFQDWRTPFLATVLYPILKLFGDIAQEVASDSHTLTIGVKETDYPLGLLEGLN